MNQINSIRYGSLILLKPEFEERYIILHRHTFPGVLNRLYDSHIRNFSIFLRDSMLFSYFEYVGDNYSEDMDRIAQDATTRDWWKLTDPMQDPLKSREKGEWWARMPEIYHIESETADSSCAVRLAYVAAVPSQPLLSIQPEGFSQAGIDKLTLFYKDKRLYAYVEQSGDAQLHTDKKPMREKILARILRSAAPKSGCSDWHTMPQVFHTGTADLSV